MATELLRKENVIHKAAWSGSVETFGRVMYLQDSIKNIKMHRIHVLN